MAFSGGFRPLALLDGLSADELAQQYSRLDGSNDYAVMPTVGGAPIVESGSNSDGEWTRWADGTQQCRGMFVGSIEATNTQTNVYGSTSGSLNYAFIPVTLPLPFDTTNYFVTGITTARGIYERSSQSDISYFIAKLVYTGTSSDVPFLWSATGRWK